MRTIAFMASLSIFTLPVMAEILPCEKLQARVDAKLQEKGIQSYTLEVVPIEIPGNSAASGVPATTKVIKGKEVGTCDGGTKRLIYTRGN
jgi:hypothetical protein